MGVNPKIGVFYPQNGWFISWKTLLKLMIWGYHYFWKHPNPPENENAKKSVGFWIVLVNVRVVAVVFP